MKWQKTEKKPLIWFHLFTQSSFGQGIIGFRNGIDVGSWTPFRGQGENSFMLEPNPWKLFQQLLIWRQCSPKLEPFRNLKIWQRKKKKTVSSTCQYHLLVTFYIPKRLYPNFLCPGLLWILPKIIFFQAENEQRFIMYTEVNHTRVCLQSNQNLCFSSRCERPQVYISGEHKVAFKPKYWCGLG